MSTRRATAHRELRSDATPETYPAFLAGLKQRIRNVRLRATLSVNRELILLYWNIGREILNRQRNEGWGAKVIDRLAADLRRAFPEMTGISARNLNYMRSFAEAWADEQFASGGNLRPGAAPMHRLQDARTDE